MNKIDKLIKEMCPNGVSFKRLRNIVIFKNGKGHEKSIAGSGKYIVVNSRYISADGEKIKFSNEQLVPLYINDILIVMSDLPNGRALAKTFIVNENNKYTLNQRVGCFTVEDNKEVLPRYLFHLLNRNKQLLKYDNGSDQTNLRKDDILNIKIPIPPLSIQNEIVKILDKLVELEAGLEAELEAELEARKKQYEYYRNKLLSFEEVSYE
jgi:type I restriction enzyme S subunit